MDMTKVSFIKALSNKTFLFPCNIGQIVFDGIGHIFPKYAYAEDDFEYNVYENNFVSPVNSAVRLFPIQLIMLFKILFFIFLFCKSN